MVLVFFSQKDNTTKFERLYINYNKLMYKVSYEILQDRYLAEDAIHEAFERVAKNLDKINEEDVARTRNYLVTICRNVAKDIYKKQHKSGTYGDVEEVVSPDKADYTYNPLDIIIEKETDNRITEAAIKLDPIYRDVFLFRHSNEMSFDKIAEQLGITEAAARKRYARAKYKIVQELKKEESK